MLYHLVLLRCSFIVWLCLFFFIRIAKDPSDWTKKSSHAHTHTSHTAMYTCTRPQSFHSLLLIFFLISFVGFLFSFFKTKKIARWKFHSDNIQCLVYRLFYPLSLLQHRHFYKACVFGVFFIFFFVLFRWMLLHSAVRYHCESFFSVRNTIESLMWY